MKKELVIDSFKAGKYPQGEFSTAMLNEIANGYDPAKYEAPIMIGHVSDYKGRTMIPAYGWIGKAKVVGENLKLVASEFSQELKDLIKGGYYKKVSAAFFQPNDPNNPNPGKWSLHHLAFLGAIPPAVKGLEGVAFAEVALAEFGESVTFGDLPTALEEVESLASQDTYENIQECFAICLSKIQEAISADTDEETKKTRINLALTDCYSETRKEVDGHFSFVDKVEKMEEKGEQEYSSVKTRLIELAQKIMHRKSRKEQKEMDAKLEQEYKDKITALETQLSEFAEAKRIADEAKAKADAEFAEAEAVKADNALRAEINQFCEENKLNTKKMEDLKIQDLMFNMAKANTSIEFNEGENKVTKTNLEIFKEIAKGFVTAPAGESKEFTEQPKENLSVIEFAEKHYNDNKNKFEGLNKKQAISKILIDITTGKLKKS